MKDLLCEIIAGEIPVTNVQDILTLLEVPPEKEMGIWHCHVLVLLRY